MEPSSPNCQLLNQDIILAILALLDVHELLMMRQVCKWFDALTREHAVWSWRYSEMVRQRQLPPSLYTASPSTCDMEAAVRRSASVDANWIRANPKLRSLRFVQVTTALVPDLSTSLSTGMLNSSNTFLAPGGQQLLIFDSDGVSGLNLEDSSAGVKRSFGVSDAGRGGECQALAWSVFLDDSEGTLTFLGSFEMNGMLGEGYALWSGDFRSSPPTYSFRGCVSIPALSWDIQATDEWLIFLRAANNASATIFDWKARTRREPFRCARFSCPLISFDFCHTTVNLLSDGNVLAVAFLDNSINLLPPPRFSLINHISEAPQIEMITPIWRYQHNTIDPQFCIPSTTLPQRWYHPPERERIRRTSTLLISKLHGCFYRAVTGPEGAERTGHGSLQGLRCRHTSTFRATRTRMLSATLHDTRDGWSIGCHSFNPDLDSNDEALQYHGSFDLKMKDVPGLDYQLPYGDWEESVSLQIHFDDESGRMCFQLPRPPNSRDGSPGFTSIIVLDMI